MEELDNYPAFFKSKAIDMLSDHHDYYLLVNAISLRVRQLQLGDRPMAHPADGSHDLVAIAKAELSEGKIEIVPRALARPVYEPENEETNYDQLLGVDDDDHLSFDIADEEE